MVIGYLRVSTCKQHLEIQREEINKFASKKGLEIDKWVEEIVSGKTRRQERNLGRLLTRLKKGDILIVTELSRLSRTLTEVMTILGRCMEREIILYSTKDRYAFDDSINSKVLAFAFGLVAEIEHNLMSMRTKEALAHRKTAGMQLGRPKGSYHKQSFLDENLQEVMDMLERGETVATICQYFNVSRNTFYQFKRNNGL